MGNPEESPNQIPKNNLFTRFDCGDTQEQCKRLGKKTPAGGGK
jgi:hypothetical protein